MRCMGNSSHCPARQVSEREKRGSARTAPRLAFPSSSLPTPPAPQRDKATRTNCNCSRKERKRAQLLFQLIALGGCSAAAAKGGGVGTLRGAARGWMAGAGAEQGRGDTTKHTAFGVLQVKSNLNIFME